MSEIKVNKLTPRTNCGTVTLGDSGDTFTIPAGVTITNNGTQTGFGREGSVDWQTSSIKTTTFTAVSGQGFFADTSSGVITMNLPAGTAGAIVAVADYTRTFGTHALTITPNGSQKIGGTNASATLNKDGESATFVYVDSTEGWINVQQTETSVAGVTFLTATGGTVTTVCTNFKVHTFTGPGTFCVSSISSVPAENTVSYLVVGGGGAGGKPDRSGGGGAGGFRENKGPVDTYTASPIEGSADVAITATAYPITVGAGGAVSVPACGGSGSNSIFSTITSAGGGAGGGYNNPTNGTPGGSGGGGSIGSGVGGTGNSPPVSPVQGKNGGCGPSGIAGPNSGGGGGGATASGGNGGSPAAGAGGAGATTSITGSPVARAGGGGGGACNGAAAGGGTGGGGGGGRNNPPTSTDAGTVNTGGGGGGNGTSPSTSGSGGSGIVIIRYKFQ